MSQEHTINERLIEVISRGRNKYNQHEEYLKNNLEPLEGINWNEIEDDKDLEVWNKSTENFWLPEKIPVAGDIKSWGTLTETEKTATMRVFTGLTLLDTLQGSVGAHSLIPDATTQHEESVLSNFLFMEAVHAKSYSNIFMTLANTKEINEAFKWSCENESLQKKAKIIKSYYVGDDPFKKKIASTLLESFLFYSGFYLPIHWSAHGKLTNTADVIKLIIRDESFVAGTELLTPMGWKDVKDITEFDKVAQWNENGISFINPVKVTSSLKPFSIKIGNHQGHVQQHVSPGHRVVLERTYGDGRTEILEVEAQNLAEKDLDTRTKFINAAPLQSNDRRLSNEERLMIAYQADGYSNGNNYCFRLVKERKIKRLENILNNLNIDYTTKVYDGKIHQISFKNTSGIKLSKKLNTISLLDEIGYEWAQEFIEELSHWDGHIIKENPDRITWRSIDEGCTRYVQAVATLAGYRTHWSHREDNRKETFSDIYSVQIHTKLDRTSAQSVSFEKVNEPTTVYSIEVPSSYLLTRLNGGVTITGNSIHGHYIGHKYQRELKNLDANRKQELEEYTYSLLYELYLNECDYTEQIYDDLGLTDDVKKFLRYNANKALQNLGYENLFPVSETKASPAILTGISGITENHDFFSGAGSSYIIGTEEETEDDDWDF